MREVSCKATQIILEGLDASRIDLVELTRGLPQTLEQLRDPSARADWRTLVDLLDRIETRHGTTITMEELGARMVRVPAFDLLQRAGRLVMSPRQIYEVANRLVAPALFPNVVVEGRFTPPQRLVQTGRLLPGYRESAAFFRLCHANVAALPRVLGLPPAIIEEQQVTGREGRLVLRLPQSHTIATRVVRGVRAIATLRSSWRGIARQQRELEARLATLRISRQELQHLLEDLPDGVLVHRDGVIRWVNAKSVEVFGKAREELVGLHVVELVVVEDRDRLARLIARAPDELGSEQRECWVRRPDGSMRLMQSGTAQHIHFDGEPARLVVLRDVTEAHQLREQAAISDRLATIGALAAGVAHEINNPLAYVRLNLEMASRHPAVPDGSDLGKSLELAREGTDRAIRIVRDLKTLSDVRDEPIEAVDLEALLESTMALAECTVAAKARVVKDYGAAPPALGTRGKLGQVFINLLSNAADAIPEGDPSAHTIRVSTSTDDKGRAVVEISDTGGGIPREIAHRVFEPFFTTKPAGQGTGLGLAMCRRIVTELGGEIAFACERGTTTFTVRLVAAPS